MKWDCLQTLTPILPNSPQIAELKILTRGYDQQMRHQKRLSVQLRQTLKSFYRRPLEVFGELCHPSFRGFLRQVQTPQELGMGAYFGDEEGLFL